MDRHRVPTLLAAVGLAVTACGSSETVPQGTHTPSTAAAPTASATPTPTPTATASTMDRSAPPPDEVTEAYVQQVLEAIYEVEAEVIRREVTAAAAGATAPPEEAVELLSTIYDGRQLVFALQDIGNDWADGELTDVFARTPAPSIVEVQDVMEVTDNCILTTFDLDRSPTLVTRREPSLLIALLRPKPDDADPQAQNSARWVIEQQGIVTPETEGSCD